MTDKNNHLFAFICRVIFAGVVLCVVSCTNEKNLDESEAKQQNTEELEAKSKQADIEAEKTKQDSMKADRINLYSHSKLELKDSVGDAIRTKDFDAAQKLLREWSDIDDDELETLRAATNRQQELHNLAQETASLLESLKALNEKADQEAMNIYDRLSTIDSGNKTYKEKYDYYRKLVRSQWKYRASLDQMSGNMKRFGSIESLNAIELNPPYGGMQTGALTLRVDPRRGKDIYLSVDRGQFRCSYTDCSVLVRFDDKKPMRFSASGASSGASNTIFIQGYARFVSQLSKSDTLRIEAEFFRNGNIIFEYDVSGFSEKKLNSSK